MNRIKRDAVFFTSGGIGYGLIEVLWRGHTHWSMMLAGGVCFMMFSEIAKRFRHRSLLCKSAICAGCVTVVEFLFGVIFNILLKKNVWNYSHMALNICGQVCLLYTVLWGILGAMCMPLVELMNRKLDSGTVFQTHMNRQLRIK